MSRKEKADGEIRTILTAINELNKLGRGLPQLTAINAVEVATHKVLKTFDKEINDEDISNN